jgi:hypothetical protein
MATEAMAAAVDLTIRLVAVGIAIAGVETIIDRAAYRRGGPFEAAVFETLQGFKPPALLQGSAGIIGLAMIQTAAAALLVMGGPLGSTGRHALVAATVSFVLIRWRRVLGGDGAEQVSAIVLISLTLALLPGWNDVRIGIAVVFITAQAVLAYFTAGIAKLVSPVWRGGTAVPAIINTHGHGLALASSLFHRHASLGRWSSWSVMTFELFFPAVLLAPAPIAEALLAVGLLFHLACAIVMGLNGFLWAFPATYPCVWACRNALRGANWPWALFTGQPS